MIKKKLNDLRLYQHDQPEHQHTNKTLFAANLQISCFVDAHTLYPNMLIILQSQGLRAFPNVNIKQYNHSDLSHDHAGCSSLLSNTISFQISHHVKKAPFSLCISVDAFTS